MSWLTDITQALKAYLAVGILAIAPIGNQTVAAQELPSSDLQILSGSSVSVSFLVLGAERREGDVVEVSTVTVYEPGISRPNGLIVVETARARIDCERRTREDIYVRGFTEEGTFVEAIQPGPPVVISENNLFDFVARIHCDGLQIRMNPVRGYEAAIALARTRLRD